MEIATVRIQRFRGFLSAEIAPRGHVVLVGEPRAGRTDLITALRRVLDPRSTAARVDPLDIHRPTEVDAKGIQLATEVEVTLVGLGSELEQLLDPFVELVDDSTGLIALPEASADAVIGVRICFRATYDNDSDSGEHLVYWPARSDPASGRFERVRRKDREALPFLFVRPGAALQIRAEGAMRRLIEDQNPDELRDALETLEVSVAAAAEDFSTSPALEVGFSRLLAAGAKDLLGLDDPSLVTFVAEDGSLAGLLRALQPALELDSGGSLPLQAHGSTASATLAATEAIVASEDVESGLVVVVDDFGDQLDASSAEFLAARLRRRSSQLWISTRRPDVLRSFEPEEILRLTRRGDSRLQHRLDATVDRKARRARRDLLEQLLGAMSSRTVVLMEGPHDVEGYSALAIRIARRSNDTSRLPAAHATRLISAPGQGGGKDSMPRLAELAAALGFRVRAVMDGDKPGEDEALLDEMESLTEQLVVLPARTAVEGALVKGLDATQLRVALNVMVESYGIDGDPDEIADDEIAQRIVKDKVLKGKGGLHKPWVESLPTGARPPIAMEVLKTVCSDTVGRVDLAEPA